MARRRAGTSRSSIVVGALAALMASACAQQTQTPAPRTALALSDAETVFVGFNDPRERVSEQIRLLYGMDSVPLSTTAGQVDDETVQVEVRSDAEAPQGTSGVRCFVYDLDAEMQQAHLDELLTSSCPDLDGSAPNEPEADE